MARDIGYWLYHSFFDPGGGLWDLCAALPAFIWAHRWWKRTGKRHLEMLRYLYEKEVKQ